MLGFVKVVAKMWIVDRIVLLWSIPDEWRLLDAMA